MVIHVFTLRDQLLGFAFSVLQDVFVLEVDIFRKCLSFLALEHKFCHFRTNSSREKGYCRGEELCAVSRSKGKPKGISHQIVDEQS